MSSAEASSLRENGIAGKRTRAAARAKVEERHDRLASRLQGSEAP
jgi:hypothetical protein